MVVRTSVRYRCFLHGGSSAELSRASGIDNHLRSTHKRGRQRSEYRAANQRCEWEWRSRPRGTCTLLSGILVGEPANGRVSRDQRLRNQVGASHEDSEDNRRIISKKLQKFRPIILKLPVTVKQRCTHGNPGRIPLKRLDKQPG